MSNELVQQARDIIPIDRNVQSILSGSNLVRVMTRFTGSEDKTRQLILQISRLCHQTPKLAECSSISIAAAAMTVASTGLELGEEIYIIPYWNPKVRKNEAQAQTSYKGELARIRRATAGKAVVRTAIIREGDEFSIEPSSDRPVRHIVAVDLDMALPPGEERPPKGAWACVSIDNVWQSPIFMSKSQIEAFRDQYVKKNKEGQLPRDSIWNTAPMEAWTKTVVRKAAKFIGRGGLLPEVEELQEQNEEAIVAEIQPKPKLAHGLDATEAALDVAERMYGNGSESDDPGNEAQPAGALGAGPGGGVRGDAGVEPGPNE